MRPKIQISQFEARLGSARGIRGQSGDSKAKVAGRGGVGVSVSNIFQSFQFDGWAQESTARRNEQGEKTKVPLFTWAAVEPPYGGSGTLVHVADAKGPAQATVTLLALMSLGQRANGTHSKYGGTEDRPHTPWPAWEDLGLEDN